jgi:hypothetical protein
MDARMNSLEVTARPPCSFRFQNGGSESSSPPPSLLEQVGELASGTGLKGITDRQIKLSCQCTVPSFSHVSLLSRPDTMAFSAKVTVGGT